MCYPQQVVAVRLYQRRQGVPSISLCFAGHTLHSSSTSSRYNTALSALRCRRPLCKRMLGVGPWVVTMRTVEPIAQGVE